MTQDDIQSQSSPNFNMNRHKATSINKLPPAIRIQLTGQHLIEASAGTGKTWTLTGILLRLLIEAKRPPEQIIATTFTRAAAAEMRERVHGRLIDFYQLLQWLDALQANPNNHDILYPQALLVMPNIEDQNAKNSDVVPSALQSVPAELDQSMTKEGQSEDQSLSADDKLIIKLSDQRNAWLLEQAQLAGLEDIMADPINSYLLSYLLNHVATYPLTDAIRRTALVLTTLDKLFIGTLDSLAQKWLSEYSAETGYQQGIKITADTRQITDAIIHDELRRFQSQLYHNQPKIYRLLQEQGRLTTVADHRPSVDKALTFILAPIDEVTIDSAFDFQALDALLDHFKSLDLQDIRPYFDKAFRKSQGFNMRAGIGTKIESVVEIQQLIGRYGINFYHHLSDDARKFYKAVAEVFPNSDGKIVGFNANTQAYHEAFISLDTVKTLKAMHDKTDELDGYLSNIITDLNRHIAESVRQRLPNILQERNETTFTLQMVRLNQALSGRQGHKLARYIRHHYPIALIDESQDINSEQAQMIERIYLPDDRASTSAHQHNTYKKGFLLLVGDPKQAIYGFRGGDVANYNYMKNKFGDQIMTLSENRRSNARLITALNHWFGCPEPTHTLDGDHVANRSDSLTKNSLSKDSNHLANSQNLSKLGENIHYQYINAYNQFTNLSWLSDNSSDTITAPTLLPDQPVSIIHLPADKEIGYDEFEITALHIQALLNSQQSFDNRPIQPSDIGVLGRRKSELRKVESLLARLDIPTLKSSEVNIFESVMATDLAALLEAMLRPYRRDILNRALTSRFFGLNLHEVRVMMRHYDDPNDSSSNDAAYNDALYSNNIQIRSNDEPQYQKFINYIKKGAKRWQGRGILAALHYLLGSNPIQPQGIWHSLASLSDGERHIIDLRQLMDILAQFGTTMGEHELLSWFKQNMAEPPVSDWALQQPLPTEAGVQLMTIHKSKGLEFPIVYVLGMDSASQDVGARVKHGLYLYHADQSGSSDNSNWQRRLSPVKGLADQDKYFTEIESKENYSEIKRLGYVAFTRASEQLYIVLRDPNSKRDFNRKPMFEWLSASQPVFETPKRLMGHIGWIQDDQIWAYHESIESAEVTQTFSDAPRLSKKGEPSVMAINYPPRHQLMPNTCFFGWAKTSFTALARQLTAQSQALAVIDERLDDNIDILSASVDKKQSVANQPSLLKPEDDIRFRFVKGANAGTFLHQIFEKIDFKNSAHWSEQIDRAVREYQLPITYASRSYQALALNRADRSVLKEQNAPDNLTHDESDHQDLKQWIQEVLATPLLASNQPLNSIKPQQRFSELKFNMGLSEDFHPEAINEVFREYLPDQPNKHILLTPQNTPHLYRYLRGEIDLVYEFEGKYFVVDYKSNYLGNSLSNYNYQTLLEAMNKAGYWLQAAIYQLALHRFLTIRIADYEGNEERYLGAVEYVFLRGTLSTNRLKNDSIASDHIQQDASDHQRFGLVSWDIPIEFLKALDRSFGKPSR